MQSLLIGIVMLGGMIQIGSIAMVSSNITFPAKVTTNPTPHIPDSYRPPVDETLPVVEYTDQDKECLHKNIYWEARNQGSTGKEMVGVVTIVRAARDDYPDTICDVVKYKRNGTCAFSWNCDGKGDEPNLKHPDEREAWRISGIVTERVLAGNVSVPDMLLGADHYHADYVNPSWAKSKRMQKLGQIEKHIFYMRH